MPVAWTITGGAHTDVSFESLGLSGLRRTLLNQGNDRATFVQDGASFDGAALFAYASTVTIKRAGVKVFVGRVVRVPRAGSKYGEALTYELAGPWWYLENLVFQQNWKVPTTPTNPASALTDEKRSSLILNLKEDGTNLTTRQQIKEVVDYAIAVGASIAITDTDFPALNVSWEEGKDMTCAEVIRRQLRWAPDACLWWDYTAATPTLKCARRAGATAVSFAVDGTDPDVSEIEIVERPDLQVPVVVLKYERVDQQDQTSWTTLTTDKYPGASSESQFSALLMTIPLGGAVSTYQRQKIKTRAIAETSDAWWKKHLTWLNDANVTAITIADGIKVLAETGGSVGAFTNEIIEGALPSWKESAGARVNVTCRLSYTITSADGAISKVEKKVTSLEVLGTSLSSTNETTFSTYSQWVPLVAGETAPTGLAQSLYDALNVLQYEGSLQLGEEDVSSTVRPGHVLNLTGGLAAWATMGAQIQSVEEDVDGGTTRIEVGPAAHLGPQDLLELLRPNRTRLAATSSAARTTGAARANAVSDGAPRTAANNGSTGSGPYSKLVLVDPANTGRKITLDAAGMVLTITDGSKTISLALADLAAAETVSARATSFCDTTTKTARFLRGAG